MEIQGIVARIMGAKGFEEIREVFQEVFALPPEGKADPDRYKKGEYGLQKAGKMRREKINAEAREILARVTHPEDLTFEEIALLKEYSGQGGLSENSVFEYYTPAHVAEGMWDALAANGFESGNILDPCCGHGTMSATKPSGVKITGCDIDPVGSKIAGLLNPDDKIETKPFETLVMETPDETFDGCVTNVPFGDSRGRNAHIDPEYRKNPWGKTGGIQKYFIARILDKIKPGKLAVLIVPPNVVEGQGAGWQRFRADISRKAEFLGAHKLPSKTFGAQGTDTVTDVLVFRKHPGSLKEKIDTLSPDILEESRVLWPEFIMGRYFKGEGRPFIHGTFIAKDVTKIRDADKVDGAGISNEALKQRLAQKFASRIDWELLQVAEPVHENYTEGESRVINGAMHTYRNGAWEPASRTASAHAIDPGLFGVSSIEELEAALGSHQATMGMTVAQLRAVRDAFPEKISGLAKAAMDLAGQQPDELRQQVFRGAMIGGMIGRYQADLLKGTAEDATRQMLVELVTAEIDRYGHPGGNRAMVLAGENAKTFALFRNAVDPDGNFSDLLSGTLNITGDKRQYDPTNIQAIVEHLVIREGFASVEIEDIQKRYEGTNKNLTLGDVAALGTVAVTPEGFVMPISRYCAGDWVDKVRFMTDVMEAEPDPRIREAYQRQIEEINRKRERTPIEDIDFGFREKWYPRRLIAQFLRENGYPSAKYIRLVDEEVEDPLSGAVRVTRRIKEVEDDSPDGEFRGIGDKMFSGQLQKYLNGENITSSKADLIEEYKRQAKDLNEQFDIWMQQHADAPNFETLYNTKFNNFIPFEYDTEPLGLTGVSPDVVMHGYQNQLVRRMSEEGCGINAHGVGLGKTFESLALAKYNLQMGRAKRILFAVPNNVLPNWYHETKKFIGEVDPSKVLFVGLEQVRTKEGAVAQEPVLDERGNHKINKHTGRAEWRDQIKDASDKTTRMDTLWRIPQSNYEIVVMTHEVFAMIPMKKETIGDYADRMVHLSLMSKKDREALEGEGRKKSYNDAKSELADAEKFADDGTKKRQEYPYLEDMGFDSIMVDEAHKFKNLWQPEKNQGVAYLPTAGAAQRSMDMSMKMDWLRQANGQRGAYMMTATPVSNSPIEAYTMLQYVAPPEEFERFGVRTMDDFVDTFAQIEMVDKASITGEIRRVDGIVGFKKLSGLRNLLGKYIDRKGPEDVRDENDIDIPEADEENLEITLTDDQEAIYAELREKGRDSLDRSKPASEKEPLFAIIRDMDRVSTDIDMYFHKMTFVFKAGDVPKITALVDEFKETSTTQKVYNKDAGKMVNEEVPFDGELTPLDSGGVSLRVHDAFEKNLVAAFSRVKIAEKDVTHPLNPKYAKVVGLAKGHLSAGGKQIVFTEEKKQHHVLRRLLQMELGLKDDEIGVINADDAKKDKLQQISDRYNSEKIKLVVANCRAEVGVNLQKGTTAIYHLTLPWTPASIEQRNGRGVRQGNENETVKVYYLCAGRSMDIVRMDALKGKANWMNPLWSGKEARMANGDTEDDAMIGAIMFSDDPEAARAAIAQKKAEERAAAEDRDRMAMNNRLQVLASNMAALAKLDIEKDALRATLPGEIRTLEQRIARIKESGQKAETPEEKATLATRLKRASEDLISKKHRLENLDTIFENRRVKIQGVVTQTQGYLRSRARKGELPFNELLIDKPHEALTSRNGKQVYAIGDQFDAGSEGVFQIATIDIEEKRFTIKILVPSTSQQYTRRFKNEHIAYDIADLEPSEKNPIARCRFSPEELSLKLLLVKRFTYPALTEIERHVFMEHRGEMTFEYGGAWLVNDASPRWIDRTPEDVATIIYPEPSNEEFRNKAAKAAVTYIREKLVAPYVLTRCLQSLFGDYQALLDQYKTLVPESEIRAAVVSITERVFKEIDPAMMPTELYAQFRHYVWTDVMDLVNAELLPRGDNKEEMRRIAQEYLAQKEAHCRDEATRFKAELKAKEEAAITDHPDYKEVPEGLQQQFKALGITVKTNSKPVTFPSRGRYRDTELTERFGYWFFTDAHGKNGKLYRAKDLLKARFNAKFGTDGRPDLSGAWWYVPSKYDLNEVYDTIR